MKLVVHKRTGTVYVVQRETLLHAEVAVAKWILKEEHNSQDFDAIELPEPGDTGIMPVRRDALDRMLFGCQKQK